MSMLELAAASEVRARVLALETRVLVLEEKVNEMLTVLESYMAKMNTIIDRALQIDPSLAGRMRDS